MSIWLLGKLLVKNSLNTTNFFDSRAPLEYLRGPAYITIYIEVLSIHCTHLSVSKLAQKEQFSAKTSRRHIVVIKMAAPRYIRPLETID